MLRNHARCGMPVTRRAACEYWSEVTDARAQISEERETSEGNMSAELSRLTDHFHEFRGSVDAHIEEFGKHQRAVHEALGSKGTAKDLIAVAQAIEQRAKDAEVQIRSVRNELDSRCNKCAAHSIACALMWSHCGSRVLVRGLGVGVGIYPVLATTTDCDENTVGRVATSRAADDDYDAPRAARTRGLAAVDVTAVHIHCTTRDYL